MPRRISRRTVRRSKGLYLDEILAWKRQESEIDSQKLPEAELRALASMSPEPKDFVGALKSRRPAIVATIQRASPARGLLARRFNAATIARTYFEAGADAIAVWIDRRYSQGSVEALAAVREAVPEVPILALDFVISRRQVLAARAFGSDAVAIFVSAIGKKDLADMVKYTRSLGMSALAVIESEADAAKALEVEPDALVIASRDTRTFQLAEGRCNRLRKAVGGRFFLCWEAEMSPGQLVSIGAGGLMTGESVARLSPEAARNWIRSFVDGREENVR
jgi:indole-3-glycerol phosphate synthase